MSFPLNSWEDLNAKTIRAKQETEDATYQKDNRADIPVKTPFNTFLVDGTHYQAKNQSQLKGTAYTRVTGSGDIESDFRLERGRNFSVKLDPETEQFILKVGESRMPLYPLLRTMGASEEQIRQQWGGPIAQKNQMSVSGSDKVIKKFARKVFGEARLKDQPDEAVTEMVHDHFTVGSHLNPEASRLTLGQDYSRVTPEAVLAATGRILDLHRGIGKPDSRDEIYYKRFRDLPETGKEFLRENEPNLQRRIARQLEKQEITEADLRSIFGPGLINPTVKAIFSRTKLQGAGETTNILDVLSSDSKVTVTSEHGISSEHKVTEQARDVRARDKNPLSILNRTSDLFLLLRRHDEKHIFILDSELKIRHWMIQVNVIQCRIFCHTHE